MYKLDQIKEHNTKKGIVLIKISNGKEFRSLSSQFKIKHGPLVKDGINYLVEIYDINSVNYLILSDNQVSIVDIKSYLFFVYYHRIKRIDRTEKFKVKEIK